MSEQSNTGTQDSTAIIAAAMRSIKQLEGRIETAVKQYDHLKQDCEKWRWASEMNHLQLLYNERGRYPRGCAR